MLPLLIVMHNGVYIKAKIHIGTCEAQMKARIEYLWPIVHEHMILCHWLLGKGF